MGASTDAGADGVGERVGDESGLLTDAGREALGDVPEEWDVEVREISGQVCVEATCENYRSAGTSFDENTNDTEAENWYSKSVVALDHPQRDGWQVVGKRGIRSRSVCRLTNEPGIALRARELSNRFFSSKL